MNINCQQIKPLLSDYALQEADATATAQVQGHLESCAACREELEETRAMLGLLQRSAVMEELPRSVRLAVQPAGAAAPAERIGWWAALWNNAGRMAFAGGAMACLAVGLLGIFQARLSYVDGGFQLAFGREDSAAVVAKATSAATPSAELLPAAIGSSLTREQVESLIADAVQADAQRRRNEVSGLIQNVALKADERRATDMQQMADMFRYMQATQTNLWKEQVQSQQIVAELAQKNGVRLSN